MCLLAVIADEPAYGYEMARKLETRGLTLVGEGSIYPLLSRLQQTGLVEAFRRESAEGPPRKYYRITDAGRRRMGQWTAEWRALSDSVNRLLGGGA